MLRALGGLLLTAIVAATANFSAAASISEVVDRVQPSVVKIHGAGGFRGMEAYQTGMLISDNGHVMTVFSYVLDTDWISVTLADGRKMDAKLIGADPRLEVAVLKIDADGLPHFDLGQLVEAGPGARVLALSNLFNVATGNEPLSVQHGVVSARTRLEARRGVFETAYHGPVYVLDAVTNNPGAAGGALVNRRGELMAMLGKELRNARNNTWLNYAIPIAELRGSVDAILSGKFVAVEDDEDEKPARSLTISMLGIVLVPDVVQWTPPYVDHVRPGSAGAMAGLRPDDLVVLVDDRLVQSCKALRGALEYVDYEDQVRLTVIRGRELVEFVLEASPPNPARLP